MAKAAFKGRKLGSRRSFSYFARSLTGLGVKIQRRNILEGEYSSGCSAISVVGHPRVLLKCQGDILSIEGE
jgi:hypothetical protein